MRKITFFIIVGGICASDDLPLLLPAGSKNVVAATRLLVEQPSSGSVENSIPIKSLEEILDGQNPLLLEGDASITEEMLAGLLRQKTVSLKYVIMIENGEMILIPTTDENTPPSTPTTSSTTRTSLKTSPTRTKRQGRTKKWSSLFSLRNKK